MWLNNRLRSKLSESAWATEQMSGIDYLFFIRNLAEKIDSDWENIQKTMESIRENLFSQKNMVVNVTINQSKLANNKYSNKTVFPISTIENCK